jgi:hypothetical protein
MDQRGRQPDQPGVAIDTGCLDRCDLMLAQALADEFEPARKRSVAEALPNAAGDERGQGRHQRLLGVGKFALRFCQGGRECADFSAGALHREAPLWKAQG